MGLKSAVYNQEQVMMARVRYPFPQKSPHPHTCAQAQTNSLWTEKYKNPVWRSSLTHSGENFSLRNIFTWFTVPPNLKKSCWNPVIKTRFFTITVIIRFKKRFQLANSPKNTIILLAPVFRIIKKIFPKSNHSKVCVKSNI